MEDSRDYIKLENPDLFVDRVALAKKNPALTGYIRNGANTKDRLKSEVVIDYG